MGADVKKDDFICRHLPVNDFDVFVYRECAKSRKSALEFMILEYFGLVVFVKEFGPLAILAN